MADVDIAALAFARLAHGPADATAIATALAGYLPIDPIAAGAAIRSALADDPRIACLSDRRYVSIEQALRGAVLTVRAQSAHIAVRELPVDGDLAPLMAAGLEVGPPPPPDAAPGDLIAVTVLNLSPLSLRVQRLDDSPGGNGTRAALEAALRAEGLPIHLASVGLAAMADNASAFRQVGKPLGEIITDLGLELRFGWIARPGSDWDAVAQLEAGLLGDAVQERLAHGAGDAAIRAQERLVNLLETAMPSQSPGALERLRALRADIEAAAPSRGDATTARPHLPVGDGEDHYRAVRATLARGDVISGRRLVESGLARCGDPSIDAAAACLADIGDDLDARAALERIPRELGSWREDPVRLATAVGALTRSYLVETLVDEMVSRAGVDEVIDVLETLAEAGGRRGPEVAAGMAVMLNERHTPVVARLIAGVPIMSPAIAALIEAAPVAAWRQSSAGGKTGRVIVAVGKEAGRVMPVVCTIEASSVGELVVDVEFVPDLVEGRFRREILTSDDEVPLRGLPVHDAISMIEDGLGMAVALRAQSAPGADRQLLDRVERWLFRPLGRNWPPRHVGRD
jgi:hypothetical protein